MSVATNEMKAPLIWDSPLVDDEQALAKIKFEMFLNEQKSARLIDGNEFLWFLEHGCKISRYSVEAYMAEIGAELELPEGVVRFNRLD